jgi:hypothetical protein
MQRANIYIKHLRCGVSSLYYLLKGFGQGDVVVLRPRATAAAVAAAAAAAAAPRRGGRSNTRACRTA